HIYVDQGDCTIISIRGKNYLVDTGGARFENKIAEKYLFSALNNAGISKIDGVFISHFDEDHCGNLSKLLKNYEIDNIFINHLPKDREILRDASKFSKIIMLEKGDKVKICEDTYAEILSDKENRNNENDNSMVVLLSHKGFKTLYTGDISKDIEEKINTRVDLLKVSHHGSKTSTSEKFLENTSPRYAVISAGAHNSYGHPHKETLDKLKKHDIIYYVTSRDGEIDFKIYKSKLNVKKKLEKEDYKSYFCIVVLNTILLYMVARENYELQKDLQR
ncbi:MAG: MBL fold metallo-hydrolase, partial [Peptoniphilus rhinitidis]